jgi:hypothetical protein
MKGKPNTSLEAKIPADKRDLFRLTRRVLLALDARAEKQSPTL